MASKLSSHLVKQDLIPVKKLDRAFKRQVLQGGSLDTTLLEMGLFKELSLLRSIVEVSGIPTTQLNKIKVENQKELASVFPPKLAKRYSVIPVQKLGDFLGVLVNVDIESIKLEEMGFMLGITLIPRVVPEVRLWEIARKVYGFELEPRIEKILSKLGPAPIYPGELVQDWDLEKYILESESSKNESNKSDTVEEEDDDAEFYNTEDETVDGIKGKLSSPSEKIVFASEDVDPDMTPVPVLVGTMESEVNKEETTKSSISSDEKNNSSKKGDSKTEDDKKSSTLIFGVKKKSPKNKEEKTPVPSFNYVENDLSYDILVPTLQRTVSHSEIKGVTQSEIDDMEDYTEEVTRPGFTIPHESREHENNVSDLVSSDDEEMFDEPLYKDVKKTNEQFGPSDTDNEKKTEDLEITNSDIKEDNDKTLPLTADETEVVSSSVEPPVTQVTTKKGATDNSFIPFDGSTISLIDLTSFMIDAENKNDILISFLRYGSNYFNFIYLFSISGAAAQGRYAIFNGQLDQHNVKSYLIALDFPSVLEEAFKGNMYIGPCKTDEGTNFILDYLGLDHPKSIGAVPVSIGNRIVAILFGVSSNEINEDHSKEFKTASNAVSKGLLKLLKEKKMAKNIGSLKNIYSEKKLKVIKKFRGGQQSQIKSPSITLPKRSDGPDAITVPILKDLPKDHKLETIIALFDKMEHLSHQMDRLDIESSEELKKHKEQTLEVLAFYFPGMITVKLEDDFVDIPPVGKHGPLLDFVVNWGLPAVPVIMDLLDSDAAIARFYAVYLFSEIRLPEVLYRIGEKLFDSDEKVRKIAGKVLLSYEGHKELTEIVNNIRSFLMSEELFLQKCSIEAIGRLKDKNSIKSLIALLDKATPDFAVIIGNALKLITLRDFGNRRDRWNSWWALNKRRHRILWLIEALRSSDISLRKEANNELKRIVGSDMGYDPSNKDGDLEVSIRNWITWWENQGRHIFPG